MKYGFLDESGDVGGGAGASANLIVVVVVVGNPERLRKAVVKTRKQYTQKIREAPELKAAHNDFRITEQLLLHAVAIGFDAVAVVADKRKNSSLLDPERLYREVCARVVREALTHFGALVLTLDQRYTTKKLQHRLNQTLTECVQEVPGGALAIYYQDSRSEKALQIADAVAWALFQKHERGDATFWHIIQHSLVEVII